MFDCNCFHDHIVISAPIGQARSAFPWSARLAEGAIPRLLMIISSLGMDFGRSPRPVSPDYAPPFIYPGVIHDVVFDLPELLIPLAQTVDEAETVAAVPRQ